VIRILYHLAAVLAVIVLQTTVICRIGVLVRFYDPALILVAYLALFVPFGQGLAIVMVTGAVMNQMSAAPFGLYFFTYLRLFLLVRWSALYLHAKNLVVLSLLSAAMVIGEHLLFWGLTALTASGPVVSAQALNRVLWSCLWALGTGALGVRSLLWGQSRVQTWLQAQSQPANGH